MGNSEQRTSLERWFPNVDREWIAAHPDEKYVLAMDVQVLGDQLDQTFAIGVYFAPRNWKTNASGLQLKKRWNLNPFNDRVEDQQMMNSFWAANPNVLVELRREPVEPRQATAELDDLGVTLINSVGVNNITLAFELESFGWTRVQYLFQRCGVPFHPLQRINDANLNRPDVCFLLQRYCTNYYDVLSWIANHAVLQQEHLPENDAERTYWELMFCDSKQE